MPKVLISIDNLPKGSSDIPAKPTTVTPDIRNDISLGMCFETGQEQWEDDLGKSRLCQVSLPC